MVENEERLGGNEISGDDIVIFKDNQFLTASVPVVVGGTLWKH